MGVNMYMPEKDKELFDILNSDHVNTISRVLWDSRKIPVEGKGFFSHKNLDGIDHEVFREELIKATEKMKEIKYYTPDIEDIHIGYECQTRWSDEVGVNGTEWKDLIISDTIGFHKWQLPVLRTPYLTREQIESEGWRFQHQGGLNGDIEGKFLFIKDVKGEIHQTSYGMSDRISFYLVFGKELKIVKQYDSHVKETVFKGSCPSINEFRTICKLLKIS